MSNEAAEKLRQYVRGDHNIIQIQWIDAALAAERKATVKRIRAALPPDPEGPEATSWGLTDITRILDAEAAKDA